MCCVCDPSVCLGVPSNFSDLWFCMRDVISEFNSVIKGAHASCALMLFLCSIMSSGSSLHVVSVCVENDVCEDGVCSVYIWWGSNVRESCLRVCGESCLFCCSLYLVRVLLHNKVL